MANRLIQPYINPLHFVLMNPVLIPQYISKYMDDWMFRDTIQNYEEKVCFVPKQLTVDRLPLQMESNFGPLVLKFISVKDDAEVYTVNFINGPVNFFDPLFYIRQVDVDLSILPTGVYYCTLNDIYVCDPFEISVLAPGTLLIEFSHYEKYGGIRFGENLTPQLFTGKMRIPGFIKYFDTASADVIYEDDPQDETMINSIPYRIEELFLGSGDSFAAGVPPWYADKVKRICGCSTLRIDGRYYTKSKGAVWERFEEQDYPMKGWKIQMRSAINRDSLIFDNDVEVKGTAAASILVDAKGFGMNDDEGGDEYLPINSLI